MTTPTPAAITSSARSTRSAPTPAGGPVKAGPDGPQLSGTFKPGPRQAESYGICIYGRGGVGKTSLLATMPGRGLVIDVPQFEGGTYVLSSASDRIDVYPCERWEDIDAAFWFLSREPHSYRWVAIDSITGMQELAKRKTIGERDISADPHTISLQEWGKVGRLVSELVFRFRTLKIHTIWIAQERTHRGEDGPGAIGPDLTPSALASLIPSMALMGRMSYEQAGDGSWQRLLRVGPHQDFFTKYRALPGVDMPPVIKDPHLHHILGYMLGLRQERPEEYQAPTGFLIS